MMKTLKHNIQNLLTKGALNTTVRFAPPACTVVRYHSVRPRDRWSELIPPSISHSPDLFEAQIRWLQKHYTIISLDELSRRLGAQDPLQRGLAVITFDDGFLDNYQYAAPILEKYDVRGAFFITVEPVNDGSAPWFSRTYRAFELTEATVWESPDGQSFQLNDPSQRIAARHRINRQCASTQYEDQLSLLEPLELTLGVVNSSASRVMVNWEEVKDLRSRGHTVGSHTLSHPNLTLLDDPSLDNELRGSKDKLEERIQQPVHHLSYPNPIVQPHWNRHVVEAAKNCGYLTAGTSTSGYVRAAADALAMFRLAAPNDSMSEFKWHLQFRPRHAQHKAEEES
ncbi:MAG: polysaccharide deacetylase family protein [Pseudomonadales bacterium]